MTITKDSFKSQSQFEAGFFVGRNQISVYFSQTQLNMISKLKSIARDTQGLFFPSICAGCDEVLNPDENALCLFCQINIQRTKFHDDPNNDVEKALWGKVKIEAATAYAKFVKDGILQNAIHQLKYRYHVNVGVELGRLLGYELRESNRFQGIDLIIPIPLHKSKKRTRGYNQCDFISKGLSEAMEVDWSDKCLMRNFYNITQTGKNKFQRWRNTVDLFSAQDHKMLEGKAILLVDDVITTGATIEAAVHALANVKNSKIFVATIACV